MSDPLLPVLLAVPVVVLACQAGGRAVRLLGQPPVIGEILAGTLLGPSLLGWLAPPSSSTSCRPRSCPSPPPWAPSASWPSCS
uniref:Sodium/hydrogen antiporter n=1 Tax=Streptomyces sp. F2 TaxID=317660 RepID=V9Z1T3_9ACTN|nr:sodium:hydrogen antiporter [Streptomyces sp. F2]AHE39500.1 Sodium/hydrogen antiporter [Streptomyces sp. F2]